MKLLRTFFEIFLRYTKNNVWMTTWPVDPLLQRLIAVQWGTNWMERDCSVGIKKWTVRVDCAKFVCFFKLGLILFDGLLKFVAHF